MSKIGELFTNFNKVKFDDVPHKYFIGNKQLTSVTTILGDYHEEFDEEFWSDIKAKTFELPQWVIKDAWRYINKKATLKGSLVHNYAEFLFNNKIYPYPKALVERELGYDPIYEEYLVQTGHVNKFYEDYRNILIPIKTELVICDEEHLIGGMIDLLVYNLLAREYQLWDYKTNKEFTETNDRDRYLEGTLSPLEDCDSEVYSLQLGSYKKIIEMNTHIKIGKCYMVWLPLDGESYELFETRDRTFYVDMMFKERKNKLIRDKII